MTTQQQLLIARNAELENELAVKNRELEIEAALEKVRSRSLAMHSSKELMDVVALTFSQMKEVGVFLQNAVVLVIPNPVINRHVHFTANPDFISATRFELSPIDHPVFNEVENAFQQGIECIQRHFGVEDTRSLAQWLITDTDYRNVPDELKQIFCNGDAYSYAITIQKHSRLFIDSWTYQAFSEFEMETLRRFGRVFEQAYTRFLDLQKAEAQAREAEIQLALERVRAKTMAMQKQNDLLEVTNVFAEQLIQLGFDIDIANFSNGLSYTDWDLWITSPSSPTTRVTERMLIPFTDHAYFRKTREGLDRYYKDGNNLNVAVFTKEEKDSFLDYFFASVSRTAQPTEEIKSYLYNKPGFTFSAVFLPDTWLSICKYDTVPFTNEQHAILQRFSIGFGQAYIRFLDLQKAEAQAREAEIQLALERVRARTMAMQKQNDLLDVLDLLVQQLVKLGVQLDVANFSNGIGDGDLDLWLFGVEGEGQSLLEYIHLPRIDHPYFQCLQNSIIAFKEGGSDLNKEVFSKAVKDAFQEYAFAQTKLGEIIPEEGKQYIYDRPGYTWSTIFLQGTWVQICRYSTNPFSDEEDALLRRFASAFGLAYTRFVDLQKAETAAREAIKQASLDRVRAEIASMRTTEDVERITPLIWNELSMLKVPFIRCGVFILDEEEQQAHVYLSTPAGKAIAALHWPLNTDDSFIKQVIEHWRSNQLFTDYWDAEAFVAWTHGLAAAGKIQSEQQYTTDAPPENLYMHFLPFVQGMLYVGNTAPLSGEQVNLIQSLAEAFATAYARYEDFNKLEAAKQQVEITLLDLKSTQAQLIQSEKMASLGELTAGIAHEIQNPLNFVNNFSDVSNELVDEMKEELATGNLQLATEIADDIKQNLEKINHHGKRADAIVKGMLQHSKASSGKKESTNINALCDEYLRLAYHGMRAKDKDFNAEIKTDFDESIGKINVVPQDIGRVLLNLFNNAFYAVSYKQKDLTGSKILSGRQAYVPTVTIVTKKTGDKVAIRVEDNGSGIPQNIVDKIFQPFFTTKPTGQGTGLGLSLSYDIIKAHGGEIKVETKEKEGSEFIIQLPYNP